MRHPEPRDYAPQKIGGCRAVKLFDGLSFNLFGELVYNHKQVCVATRSHLEWTNHVQAQTAKGQVIGIVLSS